MIISVKTIYAKSEKAQAAHILVSELQEYFHKTLNQNIIDDLGFKRKEWLRNNGEYGGGERLESQSLFFNSASINVSQVQYENKPEKKLNSATALSTIIHPTNPHCPSIHIHISFTEMKNGEGYWRMMADLNPSLECNYSEEFSKIINSCIPNGLDIAFEHGDQYFYIPTLKQHRGVSHFYLEQYNGNSFEEDMGIARNLTKNVMDYYTNKVINQYRSHPNPSPKDIQNQIDYHTLYFFQVLTLDKGTTAGLLVHAENDIGILGSLPKLINKKKLSEWLLTIPKPQDELLKKIIGVFPAGNLGDVTEQTKSILARVIREHYKKYPEALKLQASCDLSPEVSIGRHS